MNALKTNDKHGSRWKELHGTVGTDDFEFKGLTTTLRNKARKRLPIENKRDTCGSSLFCYWNHSSTAPKLVQEYRENNMTDAKLLKCTHLVAYRERDQQNKWVVYHRFCGKPASEVEIGGLLTSAKAILCPMHAAHASYQSEISDRGYPRGRVDKDAKVSDRVQTQIIMPGTGVIRR